jgi:hypothetical protein
VDHDYSSPQHSYGPESFHTRAGDKECAAILDIGKSLRQVNVCI